MGRVIEEKIKIPLSELILKSKKIKVEKNVNFNKKKDKFEITLESTKKNDVSLSS